MDIKIQVIDHSKHHFPNNLTATDRAKQCIAPQANLSDWTRPAEQNIRLQRNEDNSVTIGSNPPLVDNTPRIPASRFDDHTHGDTLPYSPTVLTGCCESWLAYANPGISWSIEDLAERTSQPVSLDGGPSFARMSLSSGQVTLLDYQHYLERKSDDDLAPLYVFDPDILNSKFRNGSYVKNEYDIPDCFASDVMACMTGSRYRPLPAGWLLVGGPRSGTPIHDHPLTVAWNALLTGCKLWYCLPPDVDVKLLLLNLDEDNKEDDFDQAALAWFDQICFADLPPNSRVIVQQAGEVVFLPKGWFHVVLNLEQTTAISFSLSLRRDIPDLFSLLLDEDRDFAQSWLNKLNEDDINGFAESVGMSREAIENLNNLNNTYVKKDVVS